MRPCPQALLVSNEAGLWEGVDQLAVELVSAVTQQNGSDTFAGGRNQHHAERKFVECEADFFDRVLHNCGHLCTQF